MQSTQLSKEEMQLRKLHDKVCQTCDGCSKTRCAFTEGYHRGQKEAVSPLFDILSKHCGERGDNEGAAETLERIIYEREILLRNAIKEKLFKLS